MRRSEQPNGGRFVHEDILRDVCMHVRAGRGVRLIGPVGSGRSSILERVAEHLESIGATVLCAKGDRLGSSIAGYGLEQLGLALPQRLNASSAIGLVDALAAQSVFERRLVLVLDDVELLDELSLRVIDAFRARSNPIVVMAEVKSGNAFHVIEPIWPETLVEVAPLDFDQVGELALSELGDVVESALIARIFSKSGGSPLLAKAIVQSARIRGLIAYREGRWQMIAPSLWNDDLRPFVDHFLVGLDAEEREAVEAFAAYGPIRLSDALDLVKPEVLYRLLDRNLLESVETGADELRLYLWPPLVADRMRNDRSLLMRIIEMRRAPATAPAISDGPEDIEAALGSQTSRDDIGVSRYFQLHSEERGRSLYAAWQEERSVTTAAAYLREAVLDARSQDRVSEVLSVTTVDPRDTSDMQFRFVFYRAEWSAVLEDDPGAAVRSLESWARQAPIWREQVDAAQLLLLGVSTRIDPDFEAKLSTDPRADSSGIIVFTRALLRCFAGDIAGSRSALRGVEDRHFAQIATVMLTPFWTLAEGDVSMSIHDALASRGEALARADRRQYHWMSYSAIQGLLLAGRRVQAERILNSALAAGLSSVTLRSVYGALMGIGAIGAHQGGRPLLRDSLMRGAAAYGRTPGPLLGMGVDIAQAVVRSMEEPVEFDRAMAAAVCVRRDRGFMLGALQTAAFAVTVSPGPLVSGLLSELIAVCPLPAYLRVAELAMLVVGEGADAVIEWMRAQHVGDDSPALLQVLGAASRRAQQLGDAPAARKFREAMTLVTPVDGPGSAVSRDLERITALTDREMQIATLLMNLSNGEIADRLSISVRTVENHVSNALRKTAARTRHELASLVLSGIGPTL